MGDRTDETERGRKVVPTAGDDAVLQRDSRFEKVMSYTVLGKM